MFIDDKNHTKYKNSRNYCTYLVSTTFYLIRKSSLYSVKYKYILFNNSIIVALNFCMLLVKEKKNLCKNLNSDKNVCVIADDSSYESSYSSEIGNYLFFKLLYHTSHSWKKQYFKSTMR